MMKLTEYDKDRIFTLDDFLSVSECKELIARAEEERFEEAPINSGGGFVLNKDIRNNTRVMFDDFALATELWLRLAKFMPVTCHGREPKELNERFRFYRYTVGQRFRPHVDGHYARENGDKSRFTLLVYLNEGFSGGETRFLEPFECTVQPKTGTALVFFHHQVHEGSVISEGMKYVLRTDVMYSSTS